MIGPERVAGDEHPPRRLTKEENQQLFRLRVIAFIVCLILLAMLVTVDTFGRLLVDPGFRASELFGSALIGAIMLLVGLEAAVRLPGILGGGK